MYCPFAVLARIAINCYGTTTTVGFSPLAQFLNMVFDLVNDREDWCLHIGVDLCCSRPILITVKEGPSLHHGRVFSALFNLFPLRKFSLMDFYDHKGWAYQLFEKDEHIAFNIAAVTRFLLHEIAAKFNLFYQIISCKLGNCYFLFESQRGVC